MFCPKCGKTVPEKTAFCGACGADLRSFQVAAAPKKRKPFPVKKLLLICLCLVLLVAAGFVGYRVLFTETVYLTTRLVTDSEGQKQTSKVEYDDQGRLLVNDTTTRIKGDYGTTIAVTKTFLYDEEGRLIAVEVEDDKDTYELEYIYDDNGFLKRIECGAEEAEVDCDKEGRITEISWDVDGNTGCAEYSYHKNGMLKKAELDYGYYSYENLYNDQGKQIEQTTWVNGKKLSNVLTEYDDAGRTIQVTTISYENGEKLAEIIVSTSYDDSGLPCRLDTTAHALADGEEFDFTVIMEADSDGLVREFYPTDFSAEGDAPEWLGASSAEELMQQMEDALDGDPFMVMEYDENGNAVKSITGFGVSQSTTTREFTAIRLPKSYQEPDNNSPLYFVPPIYG